ncbi:MAG: type 2 lantipeptide synthetase LanM [Richelia sp. RM2_1_2]|nr:type 2 lantipeptide synthetase LanM [Richelia sp. RM2_1_2]
MFLSFIYVARQKLKAQVGSSYALLSDDAHTNLERYLLNSLVELCTQTMALEFQIFLTYEKPTLNRWLAQLDGSHSKTYYNKFVGKMLSGGLIQFFQKYSVLARLLGTTTDFWITNTCEFIQRLQLDWGDIQKTFQDNSELGKVVNIKAGLSDLHNQGRSVFALKFASGLKLIYKPKDLGLEVAFFGLVKYLNNFQMLPQLKLMEVLNRSNYGWVEYMEHLPLKDSEAAARYYQRAGMLLCLLYVLSGGDFHYENIIACGEYPVAIDLEMLMSAKIRVPETLKGDTNALELAREQFDYSVLSTSFLPKWEFGEDGIAYDISGLGGAGGQKTQYRSLVWKNINTDAMVLGSESVKIKPQSNVPILDGNELCASSYQEELVDGFRRTYQFLMSHKEELLAINSPIAGLGNRQVRALFRPSQIYYLLNKQTLEPKYLQFGVDRDIALDLLTKAFINSSDKPDVWQIIAAEKQAMQDLDIPLFTARSNQDAFVINNSQRINRYYQKSSYDLVTNRLRQLNDKDLELQVGFIYSSLYASIPNQADNISLPAQAAVNLATISPIVKEKLVQQAIAIAEDMQKRAVYASDGSVWWMGMQYIPDARQLQPRPLGYDLYDGCAGVALFLSALAKISGNKEFRDLALSALQPTRNLWQSYDTELKDKLIREFGIGAGKGNGSIIYTLVRCSQFLDEPTLLEDAQKLVSLLTHGDVTSDREFDLVSGTAGLIVGLLALYDATQDSQILELAKSCGYHLINNRITSKTGFLTWATVGGKPLTGIAHGAAGIAYALLRLSTVVLEPMFWQAAEEAIAYEGSMFSSQAKNWLDLRSERQVFGTSWCNGAPGIGLARLGSLSILDNQAIRQDIEVALQTTQKIGLHNIDHLCCGNLGYAELFLSAGLKLEKKELIEVAQKQAAYVVNCAEKTGYFQIFPGNSRGVYNPGFFQGMAGIGYQLLRLAYPQELPSVLLWE